MVSEVLNLDEYLSRREMNRVKRKAKQMSIKLQYNDSANNSSASSEVKSPEISDMDFKRIKVEENEDTLESSINYIDEVCPTLLLSCITMT